ncbi:MAG: hypothetical protein ABSF80_13130, partial [Chitinispirillaceae bacterium]
MLQATHKYTSHQPRVFTNESGYTLFLVIEMITILAILFTIALTDIQMVRIQAIREVQRVQAHLLAESGIEKAESFLNGNRGLFWESNGDIDSIPLYGTVTAAAHRFGLYTDIIGIGTRVRTTGTITAIAGRTLPDLCKPVLTLHGKVGGLALMPGSTIKGTVVLSHGRICKGETTQEVKETGLVVERRESTTLPFDSSQATGTVLRLAREQTAACSLKTAIQNQLVLVSEKDSVCRQDTIVVNGNCRIEKGNYYNKKIITSGNLTLTGDARCVLCAFLAQRVVVENGKSDYCLFYSAKKCSISGGKHNSQFFSSDSIVIGSSAEFGPMSLWMLWRQGTADSTAAIYIASNTVVNGTIICCSDTLARRSARVSSIVFGKGCRLNGVCMSDGDIDMNGAEVKGHLWVRSIVTSNNRKGYINYLFNVQIEKPAVDGIFPLIGTAPAQVMVDPIATTYSVRK